VAGEHVLLDEEYDERVYPLVPVRLELPTVGFYALGEGRALARYQDEIHEIQDCLHGNFRLNANSKLAYQQGSVDDADIDDNSLGAKLPYRGNVPPNLLTWPIADQQTFAYLEQLKKEALEVRGIGAYQATGAKPTGLYAAQAVRMHHDIESQRLAIYSRKDELFVRDCARALVVAMRRRAKRGGDWSIRYADKDVQMISWSEIDMKREEINVRVEAVSLLPHTITGRVSLATELLQSGAIDAREARRLIGWSDLDKDSSIVEAPRDLIEMALESMAAGGDYVEPEPYHDLQLAIALGSGYWAKAKMQKADDSVVQNLAKWIEQCEELIADMQPPAPPPGPPMGGPPEGAPTPPPLQQPGLAPMGE
jgi:hypothetical protein